MIKDNPWNKLEVSSLKKMLLSCITGHRGSRDLEHEESGGRRVRHVLQFAEASGLSFLGLLLGLA